MPLPIRIYKIKPTMGNKLITKSQDQVDAVLFLSRKIIINERRTLVKNTTVLKCVWTTDKIVSKKAFILVF